MALDYLLDEKKLVHSHLWPSVVFRQHLASLSKLFCLIEDKHLLGTRRIFIDFFRCGLSMQDLKNALAAAASEK